MSKYFWEKKRKEERKKERKRKGKGTKERKERKKEIKKQNILAIFAFIIFLSVVSLKNSTHLNIIASANHVIVF